VGGGEDRNKEAKKGKEKEGDSSQGRKGTLFGLIIQEGRREDSRRTEQVLLLNSLGERKTKQERVGFWGECGEKRSTF